MVMSLWSKGGVAVVINERGLTLTELLVTLAILSFTGILVWSVFFQGYQYSQKAVTKNLLQQEANILIANLTNIHQTSRLYELINQPCELKVLVTNRDKATGLDSQQTLVFNNPQMCIESNYYGSVDPYLFDIELEIALKDKQNSSNSLAVETLLYRLKDGGK
jgi:prepilin-type N-terminal cleavage/methylation domain-containing protein